MSSKRDFSMASLTPDELRYFDAFREAGARLAVPFMELGLSEATAIADDYRYHEPSVRYAFLANITRAAFSDPTLREEYTGRYPEFEHVFGSREHYDGFIDAEVFWDVAGAAIQDAGWVGLSAARKLELDSRTLEPSKIIPQSLGLLAVTRTNKDLQEALRGDLNDPDDLIRAEYMEVRSSKEGDVVMFSGAGQEIIRKYPSLLDGCPASRIATTHNSNFLFDYWNRISTYAFPDISSQA